MKRISLDILYVDDDTNDQLLVRVACDMADISVKLEALDDGAQAIAYLDGSDAYSDREKFPLPGMILLDLKMPIKSGFDVLEWMRNQPGLKCLPVVIFSASKLEVDIKRAYDLGANAYVLKPNTLTELAEVIKTIKAFWIDLNEQPAL